MIPSADSVTAFHGLFIKAMKTSSTLASIKFQIDLKPMEGPRTK